MAYAKFDENDLKKAIEQTKEAIRRCQELLKSVSDKPATKGLAEVADSTPPLIKKLEQDLEKLEKALEKKSKG